MHYFSNLFWHRTLHVSDRFAVHHQESSTVYTTIGICPLNVKFVNAKQAKEAYQYKRNKEKLHRTNAAISYNKICREKKLPTMYMYIH
jgi:hypothetical protein